MFPRTIHSAFITFGLTLPLVVAVPFRSLAEVHDSFLHEGCETQHDDVSSGVMPHDITDFPGIDYLTGLNLMCQGLEEKALSAFEKALIVDPRFSHTYLAIGHIHAKQENWESAIAAYQSAIEIDPDLGEVYPYLASIYHKQNQLEKANKILDQAMPDLPSEWFNARYADRGYIEAKPYLKEGQAFLSQGKLTQAEPLLRKAVSLNPSNIEAALTLSNALVQQGNFEAAVNSVTQTYRYLERRKKPTFATSPFQALSAMSNYYIAQGDLETAILALKREQLAIEQHLQSMPSEEQSDSWLIHSEALQQALSMRIGALLLSAGESDEALAQFRIVAKKSQGPQTASDLVNLLSTVVTDPSLIEDHYQKAQTDQEVEVKAYRYLGDMFLGLNLLPQAIEAYRIGLQSDPENIRLLTSIGFVNILQNKIPESRLIYQRIATLQMKDEQELDSAIVNARSIHAVVNELVRAKRIDEAIALMQEIKLETLPADEAWKHKIVLAQVYVQDESYENAIGLLEELNSEVPEKRRLGIQFELALLQIKLKQYPQAEETARSMIQNYPEQTTGYIALSHIYGLQQQPKKAITSYLGQYQKNDITSNSAVENEIQAHLRVGQYLTTQDQTNAALAIYRQLIDLAKENNRPDAHALAKYYIAKLYFADQQYDVALPLIKELLAEKNPSPSSPFPFREDLLLLLAQIHTQQASYPKAIAVYRQVYDLAGASSNIMGLSNTMSEDVRIYNSLAQELIDLERYPLAMAVINMTAQFHPETSVPFLLRGKVYEAQGKVDLAMQDYERAVELVPDSAKDVSNLSLRFLNPNFSDLYLRWGRLLMQNEQADEARDKLDKAIYTNENNIEAKALLQTINQSGN